MRSLLLLTALLMPSLSWADDSQKQATFALIIGVNQSGDAETPTLRYADDDAAQYLALFRSIGAKAVLLADLDENTSRVHTQAVAEATSPTETNLGRTVELLAANVARARKRGVTTVLYVAYAGHGAVRNGEGAVRLRNHWMSGRDLAKQVVERIAADRAHLIIDACNSFYLAHSRGPGGKRRSLRGFSKLQELDALKDVGLLLSTSSARDSHEWEGFQAGVFSHEVRSGLYGAADADLDGVVTYREIAAFIERANAAIPNEKFRPTVFARSPQTGPVLIDLRERQASTIEIGGPEHGHYFLEDGAGVRWLDVHNASDTIVRLVRPATQERLFLRRPDREQEFEIPAGNEQVVLASLAPKSLSIKSRGAEHEAFRRLFALPFDQSVVRTFVPRAFSPVPDLIHAQDARSERGWPWRRIGGGTAIAVGGLSMLGGYYSYREAKATRAELPPNPTQREARAANQKVERLNRQVLLFSVAGGVAAASGLALLLWPSHQETLQPTISSDGAMLNLHVRY